MRSSVSPLETQERMYAARGLRTAPFAFLVYALVLLWYADAGSSGMPGSWLQRPWYRGKEAPSFLDMLTAVRRAGWPERRA